MVEVGFIAPMLAVPSTLAEVRDGFAYEFKWDGVRVIAGCADGTTTLWSRRGSEVTDRYPELAGLAAAVGRDVVLDGEVVAFEGGRPSFARLQRRMNLTDPGRIAVACRSVPVAYLAFDVLVLDGRSLLDEPYEARRAALADLGISGPSWQAPPHRTDAPDVILAAVDDLGLEGIVAKRLGSPYRPGQRSPDWRKLRLMNREEFVVGGYRPGKGSRGRRFGSLLLGYHDAEGRLRFAGSVGSGFTERELDVIQPVLDAAARPESPFADPVPHRDAVFVEPELVVEVRYSEWTPDGVLRQPSYKGRRDDKAPTEVVREPPPTRGGSAHAE